MLRSVVSQFEEDVDQNLLTSMLRPEEDTANQSKGFGIHNACLRPEFDLDIFQMEVEGEENNPTGRFRRKRPNPISKPAGHGLNIGWTASTKPKAITSTARIATAEVKRFCRME